MGIVNEGAEKCLINTLCEFLDSVVTIHTEGCGNFGGFTGLLSHVSCECVKLVMCHNFGGGCFRNFGRPTITVIPIDQITAVTLCNTTF